MDRTKEHNYYKKPENQKPQGKPRRRKNRLTELVPVRFKPDTLEQIRTDADDRPVSSWMRRAVEQEPQTKASQESSQSGSSTRSQLWMFHNFTWRKRHLSVKSSLALLGATALLFAFTPQTALAADLNWDRSIWDTEGSDPIVGDVMIFDALREQNVSSNANGWRHEFKIDSDKRSPMRAQYEEFSAMIHVELSDGGKTIVAQHHASGAGTIMKLYIADSDEAHFDDSVANNGIFDVYVRFDNADGNGEEKFALGTIRNGDSFDFDMVNDYGYVSVTALGETHSLKVKDSDESYFKFGNYLQAQYPVGGDYVDDPDDWEDFYDDEDIDESVVTFSDLTYTRSLD